MNMRGSITGRLALVLLLAAAGAIPVLLTEGFAIAPQTYVVSGLSGGNTQKMIDACGAGGPVRPGALSSAATPIDRRDFSVLIWNTHKGDDVAWFDELAELGKDTDILLLQETVLGDGLKKRLGFWRRQWLLAPAFQLGGDDVGVMSASRSAPSNFCAVRGEEPLIRIPKMVLASTYRLSGSDETLLVVNVHLVNFTISLEAVRRQLNAIAAAVRAHRGPVIVAGDFNTWNDERKALVHSVMGGLELEPVRFSPDHRTVFFRHVVDAVYYRGLVVRDARTSPTRTSDHNPLQVRFSSISG